MDKYVKGKCPNMCPSEEIARREKERLLHILEMIPGTEHSRTPKAHPDLVVKSFSRSAAGKIMNKSENLRPPEVLLKTVNYLLFDVINSDKLPWHGIYDYITDRLMAVRQDMVIQNVGIAESVTLLQPIVRFHAYSAYRLCSENMSNFDPVLNNKHLQECLKKLLTLYDACDDIVMEQSGDCYNYLVENRPEFEALYILFNLGDEEALKRALALPHCYKTRLVKQAIEMSLCCIFGNFVRVCRLMEDLPPLLCAVASLFLPEIRKKAFMVMSVAYHSKNLFFPLESLGRILLYGGNTELVEDCRYYGLTTDDRNVYFVKRLVVKATLRPRHEAFVEDKLEGNDVHCVILGQ